MSNTAVSAVYNEVIKDVIENVKKDFEEMGVDESILEELRRVCVLVYFQPGVLYWNTRSCDNFCPYTADSSSDTNPAYNGVHKIQKNSADYEIAANLATLAGGQMMNSDGGNGRGKPYPYLISSPNNSNNINNGHHYVSTTITDTTAALGMSNASQTVTTVDQKMFMEQKVHIDKKIHYQQQEETYVRQAAEEERKKQEKERQSRQIAPRGAAPLNYPMNNHMTPAHLTVQQQQQSTPPIPTATTTTTHALPVDQSVEPAAKKRKVFRDDDLINSDLDDTDEEEVDADGEETSNIILCLYDKVTRTKNKWKCQLKDGIMSVDGKDYLFHKGNGDFEF
ncbi:4013_t:CDS:2 [Ambispora gerdemannii]|uniref:4013_t:CDS:1 n=1 Tax=Ambispora gerdemannii TaxID=144530 RepID=A0A9N9FAR0_9GLOM|nr:4013_t:CDS:2 [Ambispora gerdemannii]